MYTYISSHIECGSYFFDVVRVLLFSFTCLSPYIQSNSNNNSNCWWFLLLFSYIQVSKLLFTNYCWFWDLNIQSINSIVLVTRLSSALDHYLFPISSFSRSLSLPSPPRARAYIFLHPDPIFLNSTDSHMANTKQVRYQVW